MNAPQRKLVGSILAVTAACLVAALASHAQTIRPTTPTVATPPPRTSTQPAASASPASMDAERAQIWNSSNMLRARAWLQEYCATSKNCKPGDAEKYMSELQNMSTTQMKLWLMKFDEEEEQKQQQRAFWKQAQATAMAQAKSGDRATQKSYAAIETEETGAANQEQSELNEEQQHEQTMQDDKQAGPYTPYGQGYYPGGGVHYHFHMYPY